jgi:hypothetical protein
MFDVTFRIPDFDEPEVDETPPAPEEDMDPQEKERLFLDDEADYLNGRFS